MACRAPLAAVLQARVVLGLAPPGAARGRLCMLGSLPDCALLSCGDRICAVSRLSWSKPLSQ